MTADEMSFFEGVFRSLEREMKQFEKEMKQESAQVKDGIQRIEARLDRQGGIINGGTRQVSRLIEWSEEVDSMMAERDGRIEELRSRIERLEGSQGS